MYNTNILMNYFTLILIFILLFIGSNLKKKNSLQITRYVIIYYDYVFIIFV
jgi:hypothetical protein